MTANLGIKRSQGRREQFTSFLAFWYASALLFLVLGVATLVAVEHGHRLAAFLLLLSGGCFAAARLVGRARRGRG
jgi:hypothetical protein